MDAIERGIWEKFRDGLERLLALRVTPEERMLLATDGYNIFADEELRRPLRVAALLALLFHIILFILTFPSFGSQALDVQQEVFVIQQLARPAQLAGAEGAPEAAPPKPQPVAPKPTPKVIPIPDPTPLAPEPVRKPEVVTPPEIVQELTADLSIGDISAPPGRPGRGGIGSGAEGVGVGPPGPGPGTGDGTGPFKVGGGVSSPVVVVKTLPSYTDDAIAAKVHGVVLLQAVIRKDGSIDSFQVIRGLGYGLEESAIREIATNWKFRPGTRNGQNVDVLATIEVAFNLR